MRSLLVTGGAGFIGANFVQLLARRGTRATGSWCSTRSPTPAIAASLEPVRGPPGLHVRPRRHPRRPGWPRRCSASTRSRRSCTSRPSRMWTAPSRGRMPSSRPTCVGTHALLKAARAVWLDGRRGREPSALPPRLHRRGVRLARARRSAVHARRTPYAPNSPYAASKAASDHLVRAYHHTYGLPVTTSNCSNNYGPYQFPEKLIPLMLVNALDGKPLPVYGDGAERARLALRGGPLPGDRAGRCCGGRVGRDLQRRRPERVAEHRPRPPALPAWSMRRSPRDSELRTPVSPQSRGARRAVRRARSPS